MGFQIFIYHSWPILLLLAISGVAAEAVGDECKIKRCSHHGPEIRFPFQLKDRQPEHCGLPGFRVSCYKRQTLLELQYLANTSLPGIHLFIYIHVLIRFINYTAQVIYVSGQPKVNANLTFVSTPTSSPSRFQVSPYIEAYTFTNSSSRAEANGEYCRLMKNTTSRDIQTADYRTTCLSKSGRQGSSIKPIAGVIPGATITVLVLVVLINYVIRSYRQKKYDELKIERSFINDLEVISESE
ncbi:hypothetical protein POM88_054058 [Heracleum sosnowskyi]|uniref:RING-type E3 ubiquitin transferase n=1 Tax=Heracleum sosnowskyi TaxID=360622 RepID=A0AAD8GPD2_9APIA|nr:hypothetical protein POM88_054058 [Heracleum sosnowskyi]